MLGICLFLILFVLLNYFRSEDMDLRMRNCISEVQGVCIAQPSGEHVCVGDRSEVSEKLWHEKGLCKCMLISACECTRAQGKVRSVWGLRAHVHDRESRQLVVMPEDWERALQQCKSRQATKCQEHTRITVSSWANIVGTLRVSGPHRDQCRPCGDSCFCPSPLMLGRITLYRSASSEGGLGWSSQALLSVLAFVWQAQ